MTSVPVQVRRLPQTDRDRAAHITSAEVDTVLSLLRTLDDADWDRPTDCTRWRVRDIVGHLVGNAEDTLRPWVMLRRGRQARRRYPNLIPLDAHNALQVDEHRHLEGATLAAEFARLWPKAVRALRRIPTPMRRVRLHSGVPDVPPLSLGYLADVITPRDLWMHRVDLALATGRPVETRGHERHIIEQVLRDLAREWDGPPVVLELTGVAGGSWQLDDDAPVGSCGQTPSTTCAPSPGETTAPSSRPSPATNPFARPSRLPASSSEHSREEVLTSNNRYWAVEGDVPCARRWTRSPTASTRSRPSSPRWRRRRGSPSTSSSSTPRSRCSTTPACASCSQRCPRRSPGSCPSSVCAGSPSPMSSRTSAGR